MSKRSSKKSIAAIEIASMQAEPSTSFSDAKQTTKSEEPELHADKYEEPEELVVDLHNIAKMMLHGVTKTKIAQHYGITLYQLNKIIAENKSRLPYK